MRVSDRPPTETYAAEHYRLEPMRVEDLPEVLAIERASFPNPWPMDAFRHEIEKNPFSHPVVARGKGGSEIGGYCVKWLLFDQLHIQNIAVHPEHRRRGLARFLLQDALDFGRRSGTGTAQLEVRESNRAAQRLYESMGFREQGRRKRYYSHPREDAILYQADLRDPPA